MKEKKNKTKEYTKDWIKNSNAIMIECTDDIIKEELILIPIVKEGG